MAALPDPIHSLLAALAKLPGIGPRSAERIALHIVQSDPGAVRELARALVTAGRRSGLVRIAARSRKRNRVAFAPIRNATGHWSVLSSARWI